MAAEVRSRGAQASVTEKRVGKLWTPASTTSPSSPSSGRSFCARFNRSAL